MLTLTANARGVDVVITMVDQLAAVSVPGGFAGSAVHVNEGAEIAVELRAAGTDGEISGVGSIFRFSIVGDEASRSSRSIRPTRQSQMA